ncbi:MAG: HlyD family efflux transporter periplasmic adaptor subunit [Bacillota bacterium]
MERTRKRKKKKNTSIYIFPVLFAIICISYMFRFLYYNLSTEVVTYDRVENTISTKAVFVRKEFVTTLPEEINNSYQINEGVRVAFGTKILEISKTSNTDANISLKIAELNKRIEEIKKSEIDNNFFSSDKEKVEAKILEKVTEIKAISSSGDFKRLEELKTDLAGNLYKKSLIYGKGSFSGKNIEQLTAEKATLEEIYKNSMDVVFAQCSGIVSYELDGYEQLLNPINLESFNISGIKDIISGLSEKANKGQEEKQQGIKVIDNFDWYICSIISEADAEGLEKGRRIKLRLKGDADSEINCSIVSISEAENGERLIVLRCGERLEDYYKLRIADIEIVKNYFEGFSVPSVCIVTKDGMTGVYVNKSGIVKFVPVEVIVNSGKDSIVKNINENELDNNDLWHKLKVFDEVIKSVNRVKENQIIPGSI